MSFGGLKNHFKRVLSSVGSFSSNYNTGIIENFVICCAVQCVHDLPHLQL